MYMSNYLYYIGKVGFIVKNKKNIKEGYLFWLEI